jgi:hypothetical protein
MTDMSAKPRHPSHRRAAVDMEVHSIARPSLKQGFDAYSALAGDTIGETNLRRHGFCEASANSNAVSLRPLRAAILLRLYIILELCCILPLL